jgi:hypothetical protein
MTKEKRRKFPVSKELYKQVEEYAKSRGKTVDQAVEELVLSMLTKLEVGGLSHV